MPEKSSPEVAGLRAAHETQRRQAGKPPMKPDPTFDQAADNAYRVTADDQQRRPLAACASAGSHT